MQTRLIGRWLLAVVLAMFAVTAHAEFSLQQSLDARAGKSSAPVFLPVEQAFAFSAQQVAADRVRVTFAIADGYYLYRDRIDARVDAPAAVGEIKLPAGETKFDPNFGKKLQIYRRQLAFEVPVNTASGPFVLTVTAQGCADGGICYPPTEYVFNAGAPSAGNDAGLASLWRARDDVNALAPLLQTVAPSWLVIGFVLLGLALALTPCMLPMLPILSAVLAGEQQRSRAAGGKPRSFICAAAYVAGLIVVYVIAGVASAQAGASLAATLQTPLVRGVLAALIALLALSMFDLYTLQLPARWQQVLSRRGQGGTVAGAFVMGAVSALLVSPCISAPLAGVLALIAQTGDPKLGAALLAAMAFGHGIPLLLLGAGAGRLLPRAGGWMNAVKKFFGVLLLAVAAAMAWPLIAAQFNRPTEQQTVTAGGVTFVRVRTPQQLDALLASAKQPVLADFYADWCVSCKEFEGLTLPDRQVQQMLSAYTRVRIDVTANNADDRALLQRFGLFGPPAIVLFDAAGKEIAGARIVGFQSPAQFVASLRRGLPRN